MANQVVNWMLNIQGNFQQQAAAIKASLSGIAASANQISKNLNANQTISTIESLSSVFIQFGGTVSQVAIVVTSAVRPLAVMSELFGASAVAAGLATAGLGLFTVGVGKAVLATHQWIGDMAELRTELVEQGKISNNAALHLNEYGRASDRLSLAFSELKLSIADRLAPAFTAAVNSGTGFVRLLEDMVSNTDEFKDSLGDLVGSLGWKDLVKTLLGGGFLVARDMYDELGRQGQDPSQRFLNIDPRQSGLLAPLQHPQDYYRQQVMLGKDPELKIADPSFVGPLLPDSTIAANLRDLKKQDRQDAKAQRADERAMEQAWRIHEENQRLLQGAIDEWNRYDAKVLHDNLVRLEEENRKRQRMHEEELRRLEEFEQRQAQESQRMEGIFGSALGGASVGSIVGSAVGGPVAMLAGLALDGGLEDALEGLFDQTLDIYQDLPDMLRDAMTDWIPDLIRATPEMVAAFMTLAPEFALALVESAPALFESVIDALLSLPQAFADALLGILPDWMTQGQGSGGGLGKALGAVGTAAAGFAVGGPLGAAAGLALAGLDLVTGDGDGGRRNRNRGGNNIFHITAPNARDMFRQIRESQGTYGLNETLEPYGI